MAPAFLPGWTPEEGDAGDAVGIAFARFMATLAERVNSAPDKNKLAFYDLMGLSLLPAAPARTPIVFEPVNGVGDHDVPAGTRVGGTGAGNETVIFRTVDPLKLPAAPLVEVRSVWRGRDEAADHSVAAVRGKPFTWFEGLEPVPHELYLAHQSILSLTGPSVIEVTLDIARPAEEAIPLVWEYWDGEVWRRFKDPEPGSRAGASDSFDGTRGLTRSGVIRLASECLEPVRRRVHMWDNFWIRGRLDQSLPASAIAHPPEIERVYLQSTIDRALGADCALLSETAGILPDHAFAEGTKLDLTKSFEPLGPTPSLGTAFYLASDEILSRPGAEVEICFTKLTTPQEEADIAAQAFADDVSNAEDALVEMARQAANLVVQVIEACDEVGISLGTLFSSELQAVKDRRDDLTTQRLDGVEALRDAVTELADRFGNRPNDIAADVELEMITEVAARATNLATAVLSDTLKFPLGGLAFDWGGGVLSDLISAVFGVNVPGLDSDTVTDWVDTQMTDAKDALDDLRDAIVDAEDVLTELSSESLTGYTAAVAVGAVPPSLGEPELLWEYWDGRRWRALSSTVSPVDVEVERLRRTGRLQFVVPADLQPVEHNGVEAHWIRARVANGAYGILRLTSWQDQETLRTNFFPVIEFRPPVLDQLRMGYTFESRIEAPDRTLTHNDFRYEDRTSEARFPSTTFAPFEPVADATPAMYFGFDGDLPAGNLGLFLDVVEVIGETQGPRLVWEGWDGAVWAPIDAIDETRGMALPGIVNVTWPGGPSVPWSNVVVAAGSAVTLPQPQDALKFSRGDLVYLRNDDEGELAVVQGVEQRTIHLEAEPEGSYSGGKLEQARLPRFGTPRSWIRARLSEDVKPRRSKVRALHANAVWAEQSEIVENEAPTAEAETFFLRQTPVVGEVAIEVRELSGPRARIERAQLLRTLEAEGLGEADISEVRDPRTNEVNEVWVRWREAASRHFVADQERRFVLLRSTGRVHFPGRTPPPGRGNVRARRYETGKGAIGNLPVGVVNQLRSGAVVQSVRNVLPAQGAADGEVGTAVLERGPTVIRNRRQALTRVDFEELAREASPAVAVSRALPATHPSGRHAPGWVTVRIVPHSDDVHPEPSFGLRESVRRFIEARAPVALQGRVHVIPATFFDVGVTVALRAARGFASGDVVGGVERALAEFLHPLTGGPGRHGWPFGRDVHMSDVAACISGVAGVQLIERLSLTVDGSAIGAHAIVPRDRLVAAGMVTVTLSGGSD